MTDSVKRVLRSATRERDMLRVYAARPCAAKPRIAAGGPRKLTRRTGLDAYGENPVVRFSYPGLCFSLPHRVRDATSSHHVSRSHPSACPGRGESGDRHQIERID